MQGGITHLRDIYKNQGEKFIENLFSRYVIINEKIDASAFGFQKQPDDTIKYFKRNKEIDYIDRVLTRYYEKAIAHIEEITTDEEFLSKIPTNYYFGFEYFAETKPQNIDYGYVPQNNLILSYIHIMNNKGEIDETIQDTNTLNAWADFLDVDRPPIIFEGYLDDDQKTKILDFIYTPYSELVDKFKTKSFTKYIISILVEDEDKKQKLLGDDSSIEGIVFRFYDSGGDDVTLAKLVDPMFEEMIKNNKESNSKSNQEPSDYLYLIVVNLMNFIESFNPHQLVNDIDFDYTDEERRYIEFVNYVYKKFIDKYGHKFRDLEMEIPDFLKKQKFDLNYQLIDDAEIEKLINDNDTYKEIYRIFINFFRRKRKKKTKLFTKEIIKQFNQVVDKINRIVNSQNIYESSHDDIPTFSEYLDKRDDQDKKDSDSNNTDNEMGNYVENLDDAEEKQSDSVKKNQPEKVNLLIGRFQPIHIGHIKAAKELTNKNKFPVVLAVVHTGETSSKSPFQLDIIKNLLNKVVTQFSHIKDVVYVSSGFIDEVIKEIRPTYEPALIGSGEDRIQDYQLQLKYLMNNQYDLNVSKHFGLVTLPRFATGSQVRKHIIKGDYNSFKKETPKSIHADFYSLNKILTSEDNNQNTQQLVHQIQSQVNEKANFLSNEKLEQILNFIENNTEEIEIIEQQLQSNYNNIISESEIDGIIKKSLPITDILKQDSGLKLENILSEINQYQIIDFNNLVDISINNKIQVENSLSEKLITDKINYIDETDKDNIKSTLSEQLEMSYQSINTKIEDMINRGVLKQYNNEIKTTNLSINETLSYLYQIKSNNISLGKGEILVTTLFDDVSLNTTSESDVIVESQNFESNPKIEIKSSGGRLLGSGYDFGTMSSNVIDETIENLYQIFENDVYAKSLIADYSNNYNSWNLTQTQINEHPLHLLINYLIGENQYDQIENTLKVFFNAHENLFRTLNEEIVNNIINELNLQSLTENNVDNLYSHIRDIIFSLNLKYYQMSEGFDYLWLMNESLNSLLIDKRLIIESDFIPLINTIKSAGLKFEHITYSPQSKSRGSFCKVFFN